MWGGRHVSRRRFFSCPTNQELVCWFLFPTPCLRRHPPNFIPFRVSGYSLPSGLRGFVSFWAAGPAGGLQTPPEPSRGSAPSSKGLRGPQGASGGLRALFGLGLGFGSVSRPFWAASPLAWQTLKHQHFQVAWGGLASGPQAPPQQTPTAQGQRGPLSTWRCSSRSTNSLGLHRSSKQWCE